MNGESMFYIFAQKALTNCGTGPLTLSYFVLPSFLCLSSHLLMSILLPGYWKHHRIRISFGAMPAYRSSGHGYGRPQESWHFAHNPLVLGRLGRDIDLHELLGLARAWFMSGVHKLARRYVGIYDSFNSSLTRRKIRTPWTGPRFGAHSGCLLTQR